MRAHKVSELSEFAHFYNNTELLDSLRIEASEETVRYLTQWIVNHCLCRYRPQAMHTPTLLDQLFKHGYSQTQIAQALAEAWLDPNHPEVFYLPELTWWKRLAKWKVSLVASIVFSLTLGIGFISLFRHEFPHFTAELIFFEPLLAIILVTVAWGAFKVINKLLD